MAAAGAGEFKADAEDALNFGFGVAHSVHADDALGGLGAAFGAGVVEAAGEFAHYHQVNAVQDFGFEDAGGGELGIDFDGSDVGEDAEVGAQGEESVLRAGGRRRVVPFGAADGAEKDGIGGGGQVADGVGEGYAVAVDGDAADIAVFQGEVVSEGAAGGEQGLDALGGYFGADAVAAEDGYVEVHRLGNAPCGIVGCGLRAV